MLCEKGMVQKRCFYEWSARVPLLVRLPQGRQPHKVETPVSLIDLLPTILDLAEVEERLPYDGKSLLPLLEGEEDPERIAFSEIHSEGIHGPCFMARKGRFKYIYVHGHGEQLFDLEADPGEWHNLSAGPRRGDAAYEAVCAELLAAILAQFDPDEIDARVQASVRRRQLAREAMNLTRTRWDVSPHFDGRRDTLSQYLP
jgi:choline-sulfatase